MFNYVRIFFFFALHGGDIYHVGEAETYWFHLCFFVELRVVHDLVLFVRILCIYYCCFVFRIVLVIKTGVLVQCHTRKEMTTQNYISDAC